MQSYAHELKPLYVFGGYTFKIITLLVRYTPSYLMIRLRAAIDVMNIYILMFCIGASKINLVLQNMLYVNSYVPM